MLCRDAGSLLGDTGCTLAIGGAVAWRLSLISEPVVVVVTLDVPRFTALYVVIVGMWEIAPSCNIQVSDLDLYNKIKKITPNYMTYSELIKSGKHNITNSLNHQ